MAVVAMILVTVLIFLLSGNKKLFAHNVKLYTYMDDAVGLASKAPVRLNGILAGSVAKVDLSGESNPKRVIKVEMDIDQAMLKNIPVDSVAALSAENVLGTKFVNITRGVSPVLVQPGAEIRSLDTAEFQEVVRQSYSVLASLQGIIKRVDAIVGLIESGQGSIGKLLVDEELYRRVLAVVNDVQKVSAALNTNRGTIGKLLYDDDLYLDIRRTMGRLDTMVADLQEGRGTAGKFLKDEALYDDSRRTIAEVRRVVEDINAGKGTAGKFLKNEELYNELRASMDRINLMIDKINAGQGTVGQLLVNRQLYDTLNGATTELRDLFKDIRANPKKFLRVKLSLF
jgi:phospholipid/cholesterol/gamma-HCH transport system substrate-binding protein